MPTLRHEFLLELVRRRPSLAATLLAQAGVSVSPFEEAHLGTCDFNQWAPTEFRADSVVVLRNENKPVSAIVLEVQRQTDPDKQWSWPVYVATLRSHIKCPVLLLVFCEDAKTAQDCAKAIDMGHPGWVLYPIVIGPDGIPMITDIGQAIEQPELATISAILHGRTESGLKVVLTLLYAVTHGPKELKGYAELAFACLPQSIITKVREVVMTMAAESRSEFFLEWIAEGEAKGKAEGMAEGEAESILLFLEARGIPVPDETRKRITECTDLDVLRSWVRKAATATNADDLFV
ncbi:RpnC/YadD family protein [Nonomuraea turcica]|uniref:hypothetical protein n=1 Tax=Nonomuraea sp. G32 TaxID=3067274 RepID=UPI00273C9A5A|nr:hypothetical protein [Nonomuraea sp. G32]MDP4506651.1 hypothetical protein [Nonomuraea sp. G32]